MKNRFPTSVQKLGAIVSVAIALNIGIVSPTLAADPFRATNTHNIGSRTEAAFNAIFRDGNYKAAEGYLRQALSSESNEPLAYAMQASLAYTKKDNTSLSSYGDKTLETANRLIANDPLRGNLYAAVGHFLQGAAAVAREGTVRGTPRALNELRKVYDYMDKAEAVSKTDPELNLVRGYMDLLIAVNLPFSNPEQAIERLEKFAGPKYLANRGLAVGYRDLKQYDKALEYVNRTLAETPANPELQYLKAQVLVEQKNREAAQQYFQTALAKPTQLPKSSVAQIFYEQCKNQKSIDKKERDCRAMRDQIKATDGQWGPEKLPKLN